MSGDPLDRRKFLIHGGLAAVGVASGGCAASLSNAELQARRTRELDRLEALLEGTERFRYHEDFCGLGPTTGHSRALIRYHDQQLREYLRTMLVAGAASELGTEEPRLQAILERSAADVDAAVLGSLARAEGLADGDDELALNSLREQPRLPMDVCAIFDQLSASVGTPLASRTRMRRAASQLSWRLERQDPGLVMGEYVEKARRLLDRQIAGPPVLPEEPAPAAASGSGSRPAPTSTTAPAMPGAAPTPAPAPALADTPLTPYGQAPPEPVVERLPIENFVGSWAEVEIADQGGQTRFVKRVRPHDVVLFTPKARRDVVERSRILGARAPEWTQHERVLAQRRRVGGGTMVGIGLALIIAGVAAAPFTLGIGAIPITPGVALLITGAVFLARVPRAD